MSNEYEPLSPEEIREFEEIARKSPTYIELTCLLVAVDRLISVMRCATDDNGDVNDEEAESRALEDLEKLLENGDTFDAILTLRRDEYLTQSKFLRDLL